MASAMVLAAILVAIPYCLYRFLKFNRVRTLVNQLSGPKSSFLVGNIPDVLCKREDRNQILIDIFQKFTSRPFVRLWLAWKPRIFITNPESAEAVLSNIQMIDKASIYKYSHKWLGTGLLTSTGSKWHSRRKLLTPTFHFKILEEFFPIIQEQTNTLLSIFEDKLTNGKATLDVYPFLARCALDIICETAMGKTVSAQTNLNSPYVKAINDMGIVIKTRSMSPWLSSDFIFNLTSVGRMQKKALKYLHGFTDKVIKERRAEQEGKVPVSSGNTRKRRLAFLDLLLEPSNKLNNSDIREEVDTFMFEGHDTTSSGVNWTLYNIAKYPEVQEQVRLELRDVLHDELNRPFTSEDLKNMKYLDCVIKESMRLFPPVPYVGRCLTKDAQICGCTIPAGVDLVFATYMIHRDPNYYSEPDVFDPDRFRPENASSRHPFAYIPFSAGPRNCIGQKFALMEEKIMVAQILRNYWITLKNTDENFKKYSEMILRPVDGMWLNLEKKPIEM